MKIIDIWVKLRNSLNQYRFYSSLQIYTSDTGYYHWTKFVAMEYHIQNTFTLTHYIIQGNCNFYWYPTERKAIQTPIYTYAQYTYTY